MDASLLKQKVAQAALRLIPPNIVLGVGSGSTVNAFIEALGAAKHPLSGVVAASKASEERLRQYGYAVVDLGSVNEMPFYVDGADEVTRYGMMIKGGGAALTREKIIAQVARHFICIVDHSKLKDRLGTFPLAIEVVPMARSYVARKLAAIGGLPQYRTGVITDNGMSILDTRGLDFTDALALESSLNQITGVLCHGLFATRRANTILIAHADGHIETVHP